MNHADILRAHLVVETEGERSPPAAPEVDAYRRAQDEMLASQLKRLPHSNFAMWREMSPARRRLLLDYAVREIKRHEEAVAFMSRNLVVGDLRRVR